MVNNKKCQFENWKYEPQTHERAAVFVTDVFTVDPTPKHWIKLNEQLTAERLSSKYGIRNVN